MHWSATKNPTYLLSVPLICTDSILFNPCFVFASQGIISTLMTNTVGPLVMAKYFAPLLQKGGGAFGQQPAEKAKQHSGIIVNITAKVGSIGDNGRRRRPKRGGEESKIHQPTATRLQSETTNYIDYTAAFTSSRVKGFMKSFIFFKCSSLSRLMENVVLHLSSKTEPPSFPFLHPGLFFQVWGAGTATGCPRRPSTWPAGICP